MVSPYVVVVKDANVASHDKANIKRASRGHVPIIGASAFSYLDGIGHIAGPYGFNPVGAFAHNAYGVLVAWCVRVVG